MAGVGGVENQAVLAIVRHHAALLRGLEERVSALVAAVGVGAGFRGEVAELAGFLGGAVLPYAEEEERTLYRAAARAGRAGAVRGMAAEHRTLAALAERLREQTDGVAVAATAEWIATLFAGHISKENELLLPFAGPEVAAALTGAVAHPV